MLAEVPNEQVLIPENVSTVSLSKKSRKKLENEERRKNFWKMKRYASTFFL